MSAATKAAPKAAESAEQFEILIPEAAHRLSVTYIARALIHPDPAQPRVDADADLKASIAREGILEPITVRPHPEILGDFMIIDGERRWRGCEGVQEDVPCLVREDKDDAVARLATQLVANSGKPLAPMEEARAYARILEARPDMSIADLAAMIGKPRSTIGDRLSLLQLGPWVALIDAGKVAISFATRFLVPFKSVPDAYHAQAVEQLTKVLGTRLNDKLDALTFEEEILPIYEAFLYPLVKIRNAHTNPLFDTRAHDQECDCGRIEREQYDGKMREYCGNPDWWRPLDKAAKAAQKKKAAQSGTSSSSRSPSKPQGPRYDMPEGSTTAASQYGDPPKGAVKLTDASGMWAVAQRVMEPDYFDPTTVVSEPKQLVLVKSNYAGSFVATKDAAAITSARKAWALKREAQLVTARDAFEKIIAKKTSAYSVTGKGAALILAMLDVKDLSVADVCAVVGLTAPKLSGNAWSDNPKFSKWAEALSPKDAAQVLTVVAIVTGEGVKWPSQTVAEQLQRAQAKTAATKVPWLATGNAKGKGRKETDADDDVIEGEGDDE